MKSIGVSVHSLPRPLNKLGAGFCLLAASALWVCPSASAQTVSAELSTVISSDGFDDTTIIPEGQSAALTIAIQPAPAGNVTIRLTFDVSGRAELEPNQIILGPKSTQASVMVRVINNNMPEDKQPVDIKLTSEDGNVTVQDTPSFTIPESYDNVSFCKALNTVGNCPAFFALPDSDASWQITEENLGNRNRSGNQIGPTALRSGEIEDSQRSCLGFITQQPTRIVFGWDVSSERQADVLFYIDDNDRSDLDAVTAGRRSFPGGEKYITGFDRRWRAKQYDYSDHDGSLMLE